MQHLLDQMKAESKSGLPDISHLIHDGNQPLGSNPGGVHIDPYTHQKHYLKFYTDPNQARSEVAAAGIYEKLGAKTLKPQLAMHNNRLAVVTKWRDDITPIRQSEYHTLSEPQKHDLANHFHAAVITKNWDTVGDAFDNLCQDHQGNLHTVDTGGSFHFRAMGGHKAFEDDIAEYHSLRDPSVNRYAAHAFGKMEPRHLETSENNVRNLTSGDVHDVIDRAGLPASHAQTTIARRNNILTRD